MMAVDEPMIWKQRKITYMYAAMDLGTTAVAAVSSFYQPG